MRTATAQLALLAASLFLVIGWAGSCNPEDAHADGCKLQGDSCHCAYGCKYDYPYRNRGECMAAYRERNSNICNHNPCIRGTCLQVNQDPGYSCGCQGTGFYGQRCEKDGNFLPDISMPHMKLHTHRNVEQDNAATPNTACPTADIGGMFPYECIVI